jgi:hypothetical protein
MVLLRVDLAACWLEWVPRVVGIHLDHDSVLGAMRLVSSVVEGLVFAVVVVAAQTHTDDRSALAVRDA